MPAPKLRKVGTGVQNEGLTCPFRTAPQPQGASLDVALSQTCGPIKTRRVSEGEAQRPLNVADVAGVIVLPNGEFLGTFSLTRFEACAF